MWTFDIEEEVAEFSFHCWVSIELSQLKLRKISFGFSKKFQILWTGL